MGQTRHRGRRQYKEHQVVVLSEAPVPGQGISRNAQELAQITEVARLLGCRIVTLPRRAPHSARLKRRSPRSGRTSRHRLAHG